MTTDLRASIGTTFILLTTAKAVLTADAERILGRPLRCLKGDDQVRT